MPIKYIGSRMAAFRQSNFRRDRATDVDRPPEGFHPIVFVSFLLAMVIMLGIFVALFWGQAYVEYMLVVAIGFFLVYCGLPLLMLRFEMKRRPTLSSFLDRPMTVWTGPISGREAWFQVCLIPAMLALATLCISGVILMMRV